MNVERNNGLKETRVPPLSGELKYKAEDSVNKLLDKPDFTRRDFKAFTLHMITLIGGNSESDTYYNGTVYARKHEAHLTDSENGKRITFKRYETNYDSTSTGTGVSIEGDIDSHVLSLGDDELTDSESSLVSTATYEFPAEKIMNYFTGEEKEVKPDPHREVTKLSMPEVQQVCVRLFELYQSDQYLPLNPS